MDRFATKLPCIAIDNKKCKDCAVPKFEVKQNYGTLVSTSLLGKARNCSFKVGMNVEYGIMNIRQTEIKNIEDFTGEV